MVLDRLESKVTLIENWAIPVIFFNRENRIDHMNRAAVIWRQDLEGQSQVSEVASEGLTSWLAEEIAAFSRGNSAERIFEKQDEALLGKKKQCILLQRLFGKDGEHAGTMALFLGPESHPGDLIAEGFREFSQTVLDSLKDPIAVIDAENRCILGVNQGFLETFSLSSETKVLGKPFYQVTCNRLGPCVPPEGFCPLQQTIATGEPFVAEHCRQGKNGEDEYSEVSAFPIKDPSGRVIKVVHVVKEITARKQAEKKIQRLAFYDPLTELPNRALFMDRLNQALTQAKRKKGMVGLLFLDLDNFKKVNDSLGHVTGDRLLQTAAQRLRECVRQSDTVARLGGDEFVVILTSLRHEGDAASAARHLLERLSEPVRLGKRELYITGSIGIALFPTDGESPDTLLKNGDLAMYEAKERGRNNYQFYSRELNRKELERQQLEGALSQALQKEEFFLMFQPQVDLETGLPTGVEALLRWRHPQLGVLSPSRFLSLAEETGLIFSLGEWVLRSACCWNRTCREQGLPALKVAVNLSGNQFKQPNFIDILDKVLRETGLAPHLLELELTEQTIMEDVQEAIEILTDLKIRGIGLAVDNFGTGHSSLNHLKNFPIDRIKIDQSFVREVTTNPDKSAIVEAIIAIAHSFRLGIVAEGVETWEQQTFLARRNCGEMQGNCFAPPMSGDECLAYLQKVFSKKKASVHALL